MSRLGAGPQRSELQRGARRGAAGGAEKKSESGRRSGKRKRKRAAERDHGGSTAAGAAQPCARRLGEGDPQDPSVLPVGKEVGGRRVQRALRPQARHLLGGVLRGARYGPGRGGCEGTANGRPGAAGPLGAIVRSGNFIDLV